MLCPILNDLSDGPSIFYLASVTPECPGFTRPYIPCGSHAAANLRKEWQSSQGFNCYLITYSNLSILLRGHSKLVLYSRRCFHTAVKIMLREYLDTQPNFTIFLISSLLLIIYLSSHLYSFFCASLII